MKLRIESTNLVSVGMNCIDPRGQGQRIESFDFVLVRISFVCHLMWCVRLQVAILPFLDFGQFVRDNSVFPPLSMSWEWEFGSMKSNVACLTVTELINVLAVIIIEPVHARILTSV